MRPANGQNSRHLINEIVGEKLTVLLFKETASIWDAQVLEHDIAAQGNSPESAVMALEEVILAHLRFDKENGLKPLERLPRAPKGFWQAQEKALPFGLPARLSVQLAAWMTEGQPNARS